MKQSLDQYFTMALKISACAALALFSLHCREVKRWLLRRELLQKCRNDRKRFSPVQIRINGILETVQLVKPEKSELKSTKIKTTKGLKKIKIKKPLTCKFCGDRFSHRTSALRHENKRSCGHILNSTKTEREEIKKIEVNKGEDLSCTFCQATFKTSRYYDRHMATSHLQCEYCPQNFRYKYYLDRHLPMHTDIRSHICNMCGSAFNHRSTLLKHEKRSHTTLQFQCTDCGKSFKDKFYLPNHSCNSNRKGRRQTPNMYGRSWNKANNLEMDKNKQFTQCKPRQGLSHRPFP